MILAILSFMDLALLVAPRSPVRWVFVVFIFASLYVSLEPFLVIFAYVVFLFLCFSSSFPLLVLFLSLVAEYTGCVVSVLLPYPLSPYPLSLLIYVIC